MKKKDEEVTLHSEIKRLRDSADVDVYQSTLGALKKVANALYESDLTDTRPIDLVRIADSLLKITTAFEAKAEQGTEELDLSNLKLEVNINRKKQPRVKIGEIKDGEETAEC